MKYIGKLEACEEFCPLSVGQREGIIIVNQGVVAIR
jgi:hypothetical protein